MKSFIHEDFLLQGASARELYHGFAEGNPIIDYHCHLPQAQIANNHEFADLAEIWLGGDHYKWRAMRANGVPERFITGSATPREKFDAWCATVPHTIGNPLYHWSHLELKRYFGIDAIVSPATAGTIWETANAKLRTMRVHDILRDFKVAAICTTDDPADPIEDHKRIASLGIATRVYPTFRPDRALGVDNPEVFNAWLESYVEQYPSPPRNRSSNVKAGADPEVLTVASDRGWVPITFTRESLVGYLSTQTNIEAAVRSGTPLDEVRDNLLAQLEGIDLSGTFRYAYTYEIFKYIGS